MRVAFGVCVALWASFAPGCAGREPSGALPVSTPGAAPAATAGAHAADGGGAAGGAGRASPAAATPGATAGRNAGDAAVADDDAGAAPATGQDAGPATAERRVTLRNGDFWLDVQGQRIEAHGGGFLIEGDTYYWVGEDKSHNSGNFRAVNCYASHDLVSWELRNASLTRQTAPELDAADRIIERPKVIYNDTTKKYVMWLHWEGQNYATAAAGVFTSDTPCGDYHYEASFQPNGNMSRDDTLFKDDDGKAYFISAARENADLIVYELAPDYLSIARQLATLWSGAYREAPAMFKQDGRYYLITSGATGWDPNQAKYASAPAPAGPWTALQNLGDATTYDTQSTYVLPIAGTRATTYVLASDRWQDPDLVGSKYIWLPLRLDGMAVTLDWHETWQLNLTTGEWSAEDEYLPQAGWTLLSVSSEETEAESGAAKRAFDDSASTFWHTKYTGGEVPYPHELSIDLGAENELDGMRYTPRQDGSDHGNVARYALYASMSASDWGTPVSEGTFDAGSKPSVRAFAPRRARYVRLVALSETAGRAWASVAELDLSGKP